MPRWLPCVREIPVLCDLHLDQLSAFRQPFLLLNDRLSLAPKNRQDSVDTIDAGAATAYVLFELGDRHTGFSHLAQERQPHHILPTEYASADAVPPARLDQTQRLVVADGLDTQP